MKVYIVSQYNGIAQQAYIAGVASTMAKALEIQKADEWQADKSKIIEVEVQD